MAAAAVLTYAYVMGGFGSKDDFDDAKRYLEIQRIIEENYVGEADSDSLFGASASAMVRSLDDKWSYFMNADEYEAYKLTLQNEYAGIGVSIKLNDDGKYEILSVDQGTPAESAGIIPGQRIVSVDGEPIEGMSLLEVQNLIRSKLNKDFEMVLEDKKGDEVTAKLACEILYKSPVSSRMLENNIGYIRISNFEAGCSDETKNAIEQLISSGATSFVFDLRNNPGGLLSELTDLLDYLLPEGKLLISIDKAGNETVKTSDKVCLKYKMAVIVNENTYSAAEFFAAAMKEYNWGTVIGTQTTGKARSQVTIELSDGSAVHISTHKYLTPDRVDLSEAGGVKPDIIPEAAPEGDAALNTAIKTLS